MARGRRRDPYAEVTLPEREQQRRADRAEALEAYLQHLGGVVQSPAPPPNVATDVIGAMARMSDAAAVALRDMREAFGRVYEPPRVDVWRNAETATVQVNLRAGGRNHAVLIFDEQIQGDRDAALHYACERLALAAQMPFADVALLMRSNPGLQDRRGWACGGIIRGYEPVGYIDDEHRSFTGPSRETSMAEDRAANLLKRVLTEEQWKSWQSHSYLDLVAPSGNHYRILASEVFNVHHYVNGKLLRRLCAGPSRYDTTQPDENSEGRAIGGRLPFEDFIAGQVLALRHREQEFLRVANVDNATRSGCTCPECRGLFTRG